MKSSFKRLVFAICAFIGVVNVVWVIVGLSFPIFCGTAEMFGAKAPGGTSVWSNASEFCFTTYTALSTLALMFIWAATILGYSWLVTNWKFWVAHYWEGPKPKTQPQSKPQRDEALEFRVW